MLGGSGNREFLAGLQNIQLFLMQGGIQNEYLHPVCCQITYTRLLVIVFAQLFCGSEYVFLWDITQHIKVMTCNPGFVVGQATKTGNQRHALAMMSCIYHDRGLITA